MRARVGPGVVKEAVRASSVVGRPHRRHPARRRLAVAAGIVVLLGALLPATGALAASNCTSTATGNWSNAGTWANCGGLFPTINDSATIASGTTVTLTADAAVTNVTIASGGTLALGTFKLTVSGSWTDSGTFNPQTGTVDYSASGPQTVAADNYYNLSVSGARTGTNNVTLAATGTIGIGNTFRPNGDLRVGHLVVRAAPWTSRAAAASYQTIPAFNYNNLTTSSTGPVDGSSGTVGVAGAFTPTNQNFGIGGQPTMDFNGTGTQTIPAFPYYKNLTSSSTGARILASSGSIGIYGTFTPGSNSYTVAGSTIIFEGVDAIGQAMPAFNYNNLTIANVTGPVTASANFNVSGTFTVGGGPSASLSVFSPGPGVVVNAAAAAGTITGGGTVQVTRTAATADYSSQYRFTTNTLANLTVAYVSGSAQTISALNYGNLTSSSTGGRTFASSGTVGIAGTFTPGTNTYTATGSTVDFNGTIGQMIPFTGSVKYNNLTIDGTRASSWALRYPQRT